MEKTVWETEDFEMKNPTGKVVKLRSLSTRRHYAVAILQACGLTVEANKHTEELIKRVEAVLTAYKTNRGQIFYAERSAERSGERSDNDTGKS